MLGPIETAAMYALIGMIGVLWVVIGVMLILMAWNGVRMALCLGKMDEQRKGKA